MAQHGPEIPASGARRSVEQRSAVPLVVMRRLPRAVIPVCAAALLIAGIAVRGPGGAAAGLVLAAFLGWIGYLSWPRLNAQGKLMRILVLAALLGLAVFQVVR